MMWSFSSCHSNLNSLGLRILNDKLEWQWAPGSSLPFILESFICMFPPSRLWTSEVKWSEVAQSCPTLCDLMDCSPPGSSIHGILQARVLEWGATSFSRGSSWPRDRTQVSHIAGRCFNLWATWEGMSYSSIHSHNAKIKKRIFWYRMQSLEKQ